MGIHTEIHTLLQDAVQTVVTASSLPKLQKSNTRNDTTAPFTRFTLIPSQTTQESVGLNGRNRHLGFAQVDIYIPIDSGTTLALQYVDALLTAFPRSRILQGTNFQLQTEMAYASEGGVVNKFWRVAVIIQYRAVVAA